MRSELALIALVACVPDGDRSRQLDAMRVPTLLPDGRVTFVGFARAPQSAIASPEALRHHLESTTWARGVRATIAERKSLSDGFAVTFELPTEREVDVVRQIGNQWFRCAAAPVVDDTMRDDVIALCRARQSF